MPLKSAVDVGRSRSATEGRLARTIKPHGITGKEIQRGRDAVHFIEFYCEAPCGSLGFKGREHLSEDEKRQALARAMSDPKSRLWWLTTDKGTSRTAIADIWKRITRLQRKYLVRPYSLRGLESRGGLHAHIPFIGTPDIVRSLTAAAFGGVVDIAPVHNADRLMRRYFTKERTSQAGYGREHTLGRRLRGSHRLDGGGDRVRLSRDLERDAISAGYVEDWQHSNARRTDRRKGYRLRGTGPQARAPKLAGQLPLLIELDRPVARLREFGGGFVPATVALEIEFRRRQLALSQRELAGLIGRSQSQFANAMRGHDPISGASVNRLREILAGLPLDDGFGGSLAKIKT
jgi:hypothetical protein